MTKNRHKHLFKKEFGKIAMPFPVRILRWLKLKKKVEKEKEIIKYYADKQIAASYNHYNYYCPHCLFQTNDLTRICPECKSSKLLKTN